jgi:type VI secretion system protein ImpF
MALPKTSRMRASLMTAFRSAHAEHDATQRIDKRDEGGERVLAGRRATGRSTVSEAELQRTVAQDLDALMNTINLESSVDLADFPETRRSILNFGIPDIAHRTLEDYGLTHVCGEIEQALRDYEPRLVPGSIRVYRDHRVQEVELKLRFIVKADLDCDPLNLPVEFVADLERDSGKITVGRT